MSKKVNKKADLEPENTPQDWHPADIKAALNKIGYTMARLAEEHGLKAGGTLGKALTQSFPIAEKRIADALELHPKIIWPSRYNADGSRKLQGYHALQSTRRAKSTQVKREGAPL